MHKKLWARPMNDIGKIVILINPINRRGEGAWANALSFTGNSLCY